MPSLSDTALRHLQSTLDVPDAGGRYVVHETIGRGGMGTVYRAFDKVLDRDVALKALAFEGEGLALTARLLQEARVLAHLEHPGIVAVHDVGELADGRPFYVMRLVRGSTLAEQARGLGRGELLRLFLQVCDAVAFANARGVVHRDLTPRNVMVGEFREVLVVDWGVARIVKGPSTTATSGRPGVAPAIENDRQPEAEARTADGVVIGTPGFMAPEQADGASRDADERADVFGLGAILRHLLTQSGTTVARPLAAIAARATAPAPDARYPDARALARDVRRWLDDEPVDAYRENAVERVARVYSRNRPLILLLATYALVRTVILLWRGV